MRSKRLKVLKMIAMAAAVTAARLFASSATNLIF